VGSERLSCPSGVERPAPGVRRDAPWARASLVTRWPHGPWDGEILGIRPSSATLAGVLVSPPYEGPGYGLTSVPMRPPPATMNQDKTPPTTGLPTAGGRRAPPIVAECGRRDPGAREGVPRYLGTWAGRKRALGAFYRGRQPRPGPARHERRGHGPASRSRLCPASSRAPALSGAAGEVGAGSRCGCGHRSYSTSPAIVRPYPVVPRSSRSPHDRTSRGAQMGEDEEGAGPWYKWGMRSGMKPGTLVLSVWQP
jgi:hypothetical protein